MMEGRVYINFIEVNWFGREESYLINWEKTKFITESELIRQNLKICEKFV